MSSAAEGNVESLEVQDYLRILRKRWRLVVLIALVTVAGACLVTLLTPRSYESTVEFFVSTNTDNVAQLQQGSTFTQQRVKTYAEIVTTPKVLEPVIGDLGLQTTPDRLAEQVSTSVPTDTVLIDVTVTASDAHQAQTIAEALSQRFPQAVEDIERVDQSRGSPVKVTMVRPASLDLSPVEPQPVRNIGLGLVLGLALGAAVALLRDRLDTTIKDQSDLSAIFSEPLVGTIPYDGEAASRPLVVQSPNSPRAEAFRSLRTNLQFVDATDHPRSLVVTSSVPDEGKTTTSANLGLALADAGASVCIVEGDLRRPHLLEYFGFEGGVGLTDVLIGSVQLDEVLQPFGDTKVRLLGAGRLPPNPAELLGSATMVKLLQELEERFDYVIIDGPPLLPVTDSAVLSTIVSGALMVVGVNHAKREAIARGVDHLRTVKGHLVGYVLNRVPNNSTYYHRYGEEYSSSRSYPRRAHAKGQAREQMEDRAKEQVP